jgi:hypothetical protein
MMATQMKQLNQLPITEYVNFSEANNHRDYAPSISRTHITEYTVRCKMWLLLKDDYRPRLSRS